MATFRTVEIIYNQTGQKVYAYHDEWALGVPTSATCSVFKGDQSLADAAEFSPTVTIDALSTTVAVASGPAQSNPRRLYVVSTGGMDPGVMYLAENGDEQREVVMPMKVNAASAYVDLENELRYDYASTTSNTVKGLRMELTVDATWVADANKILLPHWPAYKAIWTYTAGAISRRGYTYLRLVRQVSRHGVTLRDLQKYWPDLVNEDPRSFRGQQFAHLIEAAWESFRRDLIAAQRDPAQIRDQEIVSGCVVLKALHVAALYHGVAPGSWTSGEFEPKAKAMYDAEFTKHFGGSTSVKIDETTTGAASVTTPHPMWTTG